MSNIEDGYFHRCAGGECFDDAGISGTIGKQNHSSGRRDGFLSARGGHARGRELRGLDSGASRDADRAAARLCGRGQRRDLRAHVHGQPHRPLRPRTGESAGGNEPPSGGAVQGGLGGTGAGGRRRDHHRTPAGARGQHDLRRAGRDLPGADFRARGRGRGSAGSRDDAVHRGNHRGAGGGKGRVRSACAVLADHGIRRASALRRHGARGRGDAQRAGRVGGGAELLRGAGSAGGGGKRALRLGDRARAGQAQRRASRRAMPTTACPPTNLPPPCAGWSIAARGWSAAAAARTRTTSTR